MISEDEVMKMVSALEVGEHYEVPVIPTISPTITDIGRPWSDPKTTVVEQRRLHVTNLPFRFGQPELRALFEKYGTVFDAEIIYNSRGSKGFGFVTMGKEESEMARKELDGIVCEGRTIHINTATARIKKQTPLLYPLMNQPFLPERVAAANAQMIFQNNILAQSLMTQVLPGLNLVPGLNLPSFPLALVNGPDLYIQGIMQIMQQQQALAVLLPPPKIENRLLIPSHPNAYVHPTDNPRSIHPHPPAPGDKRYAPY